MYRRIKFGLPCPKVMFPILFGSVINYIGFFFQYNFNMLLKRSGNQRLVIYCCLNHNAKCCRIMQNGSVRRNHCNFK